jgi:hypothetical protein
VSKIFLIDSGGVLRPMDERPYDSEAILQELLEKYPEVLAGHDSEADGDQRWLLISREYGVPDQESGPGRWSLDHLFLDQEGIPTLVEVKRATDTRARREVVAQMLDYAANAVVYWPTEKIRATFEATCEGRGEASEDLIRGLAARFDLADGAGTELFWQLVKTNLQAGKVRLVFVADQIPKELQRIVEFLNEQMDPAEVIAVEVRQFVGEALRTLVPTLVGRTAAAEQKKAAQGPGKVWSPDSFFADLEARNGAEAARVARELLEWSERHFDRISWGRGAADGAFQPILDTVSRSDGARRKVNLFSVWTYGRVEIHFQYLKERPPFDSRELRVELLERLRRIPGTDWPADSIEGRPGKPLTILADPARMNLFTDAISWAINKVRTLVDA